jgi:hypothetical protein
VGKYSWEPPKEELGEGIKGIIPAKYVIPAVKRTGADVDAPDFPYIVQTDEEGWQSGLAEYIPEGQEHGEPSSRRWIVAASKDIENPQNRTANDIIGHELVHWQRHQGMPDFWNAPLPVAARQELEAAMYGETSDSKVGDVSAYELAWIIDFIHKERGVSTSRAIGAVTEVARDLGVSEWKITRAARIARRWQKEG